MANTFTFANQTLTDADIFGGVNYICDLNTGEEFTIGNTASASVKFTTDIQLPLYSKDSTNGTFTWTKDSVSRGRYYITEVTKQNSMYTVTAYDAMILLDVSITNLNITYPATVSALATLIATYIGCTVQGTINNSTLSVDGLDSELSIRGLLSYIAEASSASVKIDGSDHMCFMYYASSGITVSASDYLEGGLEVADYTCAKIDNVTILNSVGLVQASSGSGTNSLYIEANPFLESATSTNATTILNQVKDFQYAPFTCEMFEENGLEVGTIATFGSTASLVMHLESSENGAMASSVGSDSRAEYNKSISTAIAEAAAAAQTAAVASANNYTDGQVAGKADKSAAIASTVSCYYRSTTNSTPSISTSTTIGTSNNTSNAWEYVMPVPKRDCYFYTCEKYTYVDGTVSFSTVRPLDSETYASKWCSSSDSTYIDGGRIYANSVTADQMATNSITIGNMDSSTVSQVSNANINMGSRNLLLESDNLFFTPSGTIRNYSGSTITKGLATVSDWKAYNAIRISGTGGTDKIVCCMYGTKNMVAQSPMTQTIGKEYSASIYIKNNHATKAILIRPNGTSSSGSAANITIAVGETKKVSWSWTASSASNIQFNISTSTVGDGFDFTVWRPMWVEGNAITEWSPAPEDLAKQAQNTNLMGMWSDCQNTVGGMTNSGSGFSITAEDGINCAHCSGALTTTYYLRSLIPFTPKANEIVTVSAWVKLKNITAGSTNPMCEFYFGGETIGGSWRGVNYLKFTVDGVEVPRSSAHMYEASSWNINDSEWHYITATAQYQNYTYTANLPMSLYLRDCTGDLYVHHIKVERGSVATEWSPAPEDTSPSYYGNCVTGANTATKVVDCDGFLLHKGATIGVRFVNGNTCTSNISLNINGTGAIGVIVSGNQTGAGSNYNLNMRTYTMCNFVYDGTWYRFMGTEQSATLVTRINDNGVSIHPHSTTNNRADITADGMEIFKGGNSVAFYGDTARIGKNESGSSRTEIGTDGMQIIQNVNGTDMQIANLGYGYSKDSGGSDVKAPYYTFGIRESGSAIGSYSVAEGYNTTASGFHSHAEGDNTTASKDYSHAEGSTTTASGLTSHAEGYYTTASGHRSHAEGYSTTASGDYSHAQNRGTKASGEDQTAIGKYNVEDANNNYALIIGNGTGGSARSNALTVDWNGNIRAGVETPTINITTSTGTLYNKNIRRFGHVVQLHLQLRTSASTASGGNIYTGTISTTALRPLIIASGVVYYGAYTITGTITSAGEIVIRNSNPSAISATGTSNINIVFTYIVA